MAASRLASNPRPAAATISDLKGNFVCPHFCILSLTASGVSSSAYAIVLATMLVSLISERAPWKKYLVWPFLALCLMLTAYVIIFAHALCVARLG